MIIIQTNDSLTDGERNLLSLIRSGKKFRKFSINYEMSDYNIRKYNRDEHI